MMMGGGSQKEGVQLVLMMVAGPYMATSPPKAALLAVGTLLYTLSSPHSSVWEKQCLL